MGKDYKTMRVPVEAYVEAKESKADGETWGDYLRRCTENPPEIREFVEDGSTNTDGVSYDDVENACRAAIREELPVEQM